MGYLGNYRNSNPKEQGPAIFHGPYAAPSVYVKSLDPATDEFGNPTTDVFICAGCIRFPKTSAVATGTFCARRALATAGCATPRASGRKSPRRRFRTTRPARPRGWTDLWAWKTDNFSYRKEGSCRASRSTAKSSRVLRESRRRICHRGCSVLTFFERCSAV